MRRKIWFAEIYTRHSDKIGYCCSYPQQCSHTTKTTLAGNIKTCVRIVSICSLSESEKSERERESEQKKATQKNVAKFKQTQKYIRYDKNGFLAWIQLNCEWEKMSPAAEENHISTAISLNCSYEEESFHFQQRNWANILGNSKGTHRRWHSIQKASNFICTLNTLAHSWIQ